MTTIPRRRSALAALVAIPTALVVVLSGCASGSVGGGETQAPATDDRFASIIPDGDIVQFSKDLVAGSLNAQQALGRSVRIGRPRGLTALPEAHGGPAFATLAGLAFYAAADPIDLRGAAPQQTTVHRQKGMGMVRKLIQAARANY